MFTVRPWSAGSYRVFAVHASGKYLALIGTDPDELIARLQADAPENPVFACPVCGFNGLDTRPYEVWPPPAGVSIAPPYSDALGFPSYEVCLDCAYEFGNDDDPGQGIAGLSFEAYRIQWIASGYPDLSGRRVPPRELEAPN
jgi:hypothetical protein